MHDEVSILCDLGRWSYYAEGGAHVVLKNRDHIKLSCRCRGHVLKVPKIKKKDTKCTTDHEVSFILNVIGKLFDCSLVPQSHEIFINDDVLSSMLNSITPMRDPSRILADPDILLSSFGILESDLTLSLVDGRPCISLELKVKSSVTSTSPLVVHPHKLSHGKYSYMQQYKHMCNDNLPWGALHSVSHYDPHKLCSGAHGDFVDSFKVLLANPQNNLKIILNENHVYGWSKNDQGNKLCMEDGLVSIFNHTDGASGSMDTLTYIVQTILAQESVLPKLEQLQCLDILDTEGCEIVYRMLEGVHQDQLTEKLLDFFYQPLDTHDIHMWNYVSAFTHTYTFNQHRASESGLDLTDPIQHLASIRVNKNMSMQERQLQHGKFMTILDTLDSRQLMMLLKMAMVAMIFKDASVIVTVSVVHVLPSLSFPLDSDKNNAAYQTSVSCQSVDKDGELRTIDTTNQEEVLDIKYRVGLIDLQLKALSKFTSNVKKEKKIFQTLANAREVF